MRKLRKSYQRALNKKVKEINKNIANDNLWRGRFEFRQKNAGFEEFEDKSGGMLYAFIRGYDKATGYYKDFRIDFAPYLHFNDYHLWKMANDFIAQDSGVWQEDPRPNLNSGFVKDYTKIHIPEEIMKQEYNFYVSYEYFTEKEEP